MAEIAANEFHLVKKFIFQNVIETEISLKL